MVLIIKFPRQTGEIQMRGIGIFGLVFTRRKYIEDATVKLDVGKIVKEGLSTWNGLEVYY